MRLRDYFGKRKMEDERAERILDELLRSGTIGPKATVVHVNPRYKRAFKAIALGEDTYPSHIFPQPDTVDCL